MEDYIIDNYLNEHYEVYDRFTFDEVFRFLLKAGYERESAKDTIIFNCSLSALVFQERIFNKCYLKIMKDEELSENLIKLINETFLLKLFNPN